MSNQGYRPVYKWDEPNLKQLNDNLRAMWKKVMGRVEMRDLSLDTQSTIESKADGEVVEEIREVADQAGKDAEQAGKDAEQARKDAEQAKTEAGAAAQQVASMRTELDVTQEAITLKADKTTVDTLSGKVTENSAQLKVTAESVDSTVKRVETLNGVVTEHGTQIKQTADAITSTATAVEALDDRIVKAESAIEQTPEQIRMAVSQVQVGGRNYLRNTGTLKKANWGFDNSSNSTSGIVLGSVNENSDGGLDIVCSGANVRWWLGHMPVTAGQKYTVSVRYKKKSGESPINFQYVYRDANYKEIANPFYNSSATQKTKVENGWTVLYDTLNVPDDATVAYVRLALRVGADNTAYTVNYTYQKPKFEAGNKATDWTPAPEDTDGAIQELTAELSVQAGEIVANATKIETVNQSAASAQNAANAAQNAAAGAQGTANNAVTRVTTAEQSISALDEAVRTKVSQTDFNALGKRVSAAEGSITTQAGQIAAKVEKTEFDALGNKVSANTSAITQTANAIRSEVASSVSGLQTQIDQTDEQVLILAGRTVGGTNLVRNTAKLLASRHEMNASGASAIGTRTEDEYGGFHIVCNNQNVRWWLATVPVSPGQSYAMSIQYKMNSGTAPIQFQYIFRNAAGNATHYWSSPNDSVTGSRIDSGWTVLTSVFTAPDNESITQVQIGIRTGKDGLLYTCDYNIRRPKFETGSMATDWSPSPDDPASSVNAGGVVRVDQSGVHMSGGTIEMETSDGEEYIHIKNSGIAASSLDAPNVARRYAGPTSLYVNPNATSAQMAAGNYYRSLVDACAAVSGKYLDSSVTINVQGTTYGDAKLIGISGAVTIHGNGNSLIGTMTIQDCASRVFLYGLTVSQPSTSTQTRAMWIANASYVAMESGVVISGNGGTYAMVIEWGSTVWLYGVELYNATNLMYCIYGTHVTGLNLKGGNCTYFAWANGAILKMAGSRPDGTLRTANAPLMVPTNPSTLTIDAGSATPSTPVIQTANWNYLYTDSYAGKWGRPSSDAAQGVIQTDDSGNIAAIYGTIWFDAAAIKSTLTGKTINQVSLRLHALVGYGRGVEVSVQLYGTNQAYSGRSGQPALTTSYGTIVSIKPGNTAEIAIPTAAISDIVSGRIQALVLKSDDTALREGKTYSTNYARFAGSTSATAENCPRLTVVYQ